MTLLQTVRGISVPRSSITTSTSVAMGSSSSTNVSNLQAALNAVGAAGGGTVVLSGTGTYGLSGTVVINYSNTQLVIPFGMTLRLDNNATLTSYAKTDMSSTWQTSHGPTSSFPMKPVIACAKYSVTGAKLDNIRIEGGGTIDCNGANQPDTDSYCGVMLNSTTRSFVHGLQIVNPGLSIASIAAGQRGYCIMLCDSDYFDVAFNDVNLARYDCIGGRGYTLGGRIHHNLIRSTNGANARAGFQWAYQGDNIVVEANEFEQGSNSVSGHCILIHGSRRIRIIGNIMRTTNATGGGGIYVFGDNTDGSTGTADEVGDFPSSSVDAYGEQIEIVGNAIESQSGIACVVLDTQFTRDIKVMGNTLEKTVTAAIAVQVSGTTGGNIIRRVQFLNNSVRQRTSASIATFQYCSDLIIDGNEWRKLVAANHGLQFTRAQQVQFTNNTLIGAGGDTRAIRRFSESANGCVDWRVEGNRVKSGFSRFFDDDSASNHSGQQYIRGNDLVGCSAPTTGFTPAGTIRVQDNLSGITTENAGTATITAAATSVTVTHGITAWRTLRADDFTVVSTNTTTTPVGKISIQNVTSTQFDIVVEGVPGVSTATFRWVAAANIA